MKRKAFGRRTYHNLGEMLADLIFPLQKAREIKAMQKDGQISPAFRERLMLAVTGVNKCRYCTYVHTKEALKNGLSPDEITALLSEDFAGCPPVEVPALIYAQHWAESNGHPDPGAVDSLRQTYGDDKSESINLVLRMIRMGNLQGNTWDYFLHCISGGRWGG